MSGRTVITSVLLFSDVLEVRKGSRVWPPAPLGQYGRRTRPPMIRISHLTLDSVAGFIFTYDQKYFWPSYGGGGRSPHRPP